MANRIERRNDRMLTAREELVMMTYIEHGTFTAVKSATGSSNPRKVLERPHVQAEYTRRMKKIMAKKKITGERVVEELGKIAFANIDDFVDDDYRVLSKPSRKRMAAVQEVTTETILDRRRDIPEGEEEDVKRVKLKMYSKQNALEALGRHFGLFVDRVEVSGDLADRLNRAHKRMEEGNEPTDRSEDA